uniref:Aminoglycoside phosphotransferase domain-containing protein n=1 Tax=candidate division WWE3 bacterium TaxID=2053526 RepID=A0A831Z155_UNCKA
MFEELFKEKGFQPQKIFREGPRVYVIGGRLRRNGERDAVFKTPFRSTQEITNLHLRHEALLLHAAPAYLQKFLPAIYDFGQDGGGRFWYLVEWVKPGQPQIIGESDFVMKGDFFTQSNLIWCLEVIAVLRHLSGEIPASFAREISKTVYGLADYRSLLEPLGKKFFDRETMSAVGRFLDAAEPVYNRANRTTITHHEFYGSQILSSGKTFKLADWENVGWGNPLRDFTSLWIRAYEHPAWQKKFLEGFRKDLNIRPEEFEVLFGVEKILQNFGNLMLFDHSRLPEEVSRRREATEFFRRCVRETLENYPLI